MIKRSRYVTVVLLGFWGLVRDPNTNPTLIVVTQAIGSVLARRSIK